MVEECHPYLQLFSRLVGHGGMTKSSACRRETRGDKASPERNAFLMLRKHLSSQMETADAWGFSRVG